MEGTSNEPIKIKKRPALWNLRERLSSFSHEDYQDQSEVLPDKPQAQHFSSEKEWEKPFDYYIQTIEEESNVWDKMLAEITVEDSHKIKGICFSDGTIVWSTQVASHGFLAGALDRDEYPSTRIQSEWSETHGDTPGYPVIGLRDSEGKEVDKKLFEYFKRNIISSPHVRIENKRYDYSKPSDQRTSVTAEEIINQ